MKTLWLLMISAGCAMSIHAQTVYTEIGAVGSFFSRYSERGHAFGGQLTANQQFSNGILLGAGVQALWSNQSFLYSTYDNKGYYPLYAKVGYNISAPRVVISIHADEGYGFYSNRGIGAYDNPVPVKGGFYFSPGIALYGRKKFSLYLDVRYTRYQFRTDYRSGNYSNNFNAFTVSLGLCISHKEAK